MKGKNRRSLLLSAVVAVDNDVLRPQKKTESDESATKCLIAGHSYNSPILVPGQLIGASLLTLSQMFPTRFKPVTSVT